MQGIEDLGTSLHKQLNEKAKPFLYYLLALDENDVSDAAQLLKFICGVGDKFSLY
jgi:hypothetical protein